MRTNDAALMLRAWRLSNGLTQQEAADFFDVSKRTIAFWESGQRIPGANTLLRAKRHRDARVASFARLLMRTLFGSDGEGP
jgi:transcriptional regulator with XRE-family HTH domain